MSASTDTKSRRNEFALAGLVFLTATLVSTYPLAFHPASLGRFDNADAQLNAWAMSWVAHQVTSDPLHLFQANIFYPLPDTLAFSEHLFVPGLMGLPLLRLSDNLVLTFNLVLLFSVFFSAWGMYLLVRILTRSHAGALLSGLFFSFASYRFARLPHIQMQLYGLLPLALLCIHRFFSTHKVKWVFAFAFFFVLQALSGTYLAAMTAVASVVALVALGIPARPRSRQVLSLALSLAVIVVVLYPFVRPYLWVNHTLGIQWDVQGIESLSATPWSYLASASRLYRGVLDRLVPSGEITDYLFPGVTPLVLGTLGAGLLVFRRHDFERPVPTAVCYVGILVLGMWVSFGPRSPGYTALYEHIVFFRGLRALSRFGLLPLLSLSVLSGFTVRWLGDKIHTPVVRNGLLLLLGLFFMAESTAVPLGLSRFEDRPADVYRWLREEAEPGPIVELPFRRIDTRYMFWARHHGFRSMLNGDSGFVPPSHVWMKEIFLRFPSADAVALLRKLDVRYVIVHLGAYRLNTRRLARILDDLRSYPQDLVTVATFGRDLVLEIPRDEELAARREPSMERVSTLRPEIRLFDSDLDALWQLGPRVSVVEVPVGVDRGISGLRLHYGRTPRVPVTRIRLDAMDVGGRWNPHWATPDGWPALAELVSALLTDPQDGAQTVTFPPIRAEALRIEMTGYDGNPPEITEMEVLAGSGR